MKKKNFIPLIIAIILLIIGTSIVSICTLIFKLNVMDSITNYNKSQVRTENVAGDIHSIQLSTYKADINILSHDKDEISLVITENSHSRFNFNTGSSEGVLIIEEDFNDKNYWLSLIPSIFFLSMDDFPSIDVYVPKDTQPTLSISTAFGDISVAKTVHIANTDISLASGDLSFMGDVDGTMSLLTKSGDIDITSGNISDVDIYLTSGDLSFKSDVHGDMSVFGMSGDIDIHNSIVYGKLSAALNSGDVILKNTDADSLDISVNSGDIDALLLSGKDFTVNSGSGEVNIPENSSGGSCVLNSKSGDIDIKVVD